MVKSIISMKDVYKHDKILENHELMSKNGFRLYWKIITDYSIMSISNNHITVDGKILW